MMATAARLHVSGVISNEWPDRSKTALLEDKALSRMQGMKEGNENE
jgi:hypothetical protein